MTTESGNPLFDHRMPEWYVRLSYLWRGICFGFMIGFLVAAFLRLADYFATVAAVVMVVIVSCLLAVLPSIPKAWIEQRNRIRAMRDGALSETLRDRTDS